MPGGSVTNWSRLAGGAVARRQPLRAAHAGAADARRDERVPGLPAAAAGELVRATRSDSDGYGFQIELVDRADRAGFDIGEAPITFREREHGQSKISRRIVVEALWLVTRWGVEERLGMRGAPSAQRP